MIEGTFYAYYKTYKNRGCNYDKIAYTGGGTVGHVSVNLSLIPTSIEKGHEAFYIGSKHGIEREMIESQLLIFNIIQYQAVNYVVIYL